MYKSQGVVATPKGFINQQSFVWSEEYFEEP